MNGSQFLFEVSWEVCNKIGGIYTVLQSKLREASNHFGNNYILIGPWRGPTPDFVACTSPFLEEITSKLAAHNIRVHVGYWHTESNPVVILVELEQRYQVDELLYTLWIKFGVDSLGSSHEYQEAVLFATLAGEVIKILTTELLDAKKQVVAHFHEWLGGAGLLHLKQQESKIATIFTTHATVLGRALAYQNRSIYTLSPDFSPSKEARALGVLAKHTLEKAAATAADYFTTVSNVTADEANVVLGRYPDKVIYNGLNLLQLRANITSAKIAATRERLLQIAQQVTKQPITTKTLLWVTSGRYEFHNKGYDLLLQSLAHLEEQLAEDAPPIIVFFLVATTWGKQPESLLTLDVTQCPEQLSAVGIATHKIFDPKNDKIIKLSTELNFTKPEHKIHVILSNAYLRGNDGVFNLTYAQIIAACDLTLFPSFYEPWGYTPLESLGYATPTVTTDLSGFGCWISKQENYQKAVYVLSRKNCTTAQAIASLSNYLAQLVPQIGVQEYWQKARQHALQLAQLATWALFYQNYLASYAEAGKFHQLAQERFSLTQISSELPLSLGNSGDMRPRLHTFQYEFKLPVAIGGLRELAYNFWWSWHAEAQLLWQKIDAVLWEQVAHNPVHFLSLVPAHIWHQIAQDEEYLWLYNRVMENFTNYRESTHRQIKTGDNILISAQRPLAYFCMEYGIAESLPIYSGGLGILAGDYLKTLSDLYVPAVAIGLFYQQGFFRQQINAQGEQESLYENWNPQQIPMRKLNDPATGKEMAVVVDILTRRVKVWVWEVQIGNVTLYLLDTNVPENSGSDRAITSCLYGGSREVRLLQEIILGIGGIRLLDKLGIKPALYHLNEGHSAFLLVERIGVLLSQGVPFGTAREVVRNSTIFTTHTPVAAGNEIFAVELIRKYFYAYVVNKLGIAFASFLALARDPSMTVDNFSLTALALRLTIGANAVSKLHGSIARGMWQGIWPELLANEVPITTVTNGVHLATWLGEPMKLLYADYLAVNWNKPQNGIIPWAKIKTIPNAEVWQAHQTQKNRLLAAVGKFLREQYTLRREARYLLNASLAVLNPNTLLVGLARRFTAYKRNGLFLRDPERLARIITAPERPVVILIAGKAHPADAQGKELITEIITTLRRDIFKGHVIFLEEYNIGLAELLVQGVDLWLNTPLVGQEACGTSGMKVGINGGLNFSTADGWWAEAYNGQLGWQVKSFPKMAEGKHRDDLENMYLLDTLATEVIPTYYKVKRCGFNPVWVEKMKSAMAVIASNYNSARMVGDYMDEFYGPIVLRNKQLMQHEGAGLQAILAWQRTLESRFNTVKIRAIFINGIQNGKVTAAGVLKIKLLLFVGKMEPHELAVEFVLLKQNEATVEQEQVVVSLQYGATLTGEVVTYVAEYHIADTGFYSYGIRVFPCHPLLLHKQESGLVYWG